MDGSRSFTRQAWNLLVAGSESLRVKAANGACFWLIPAWFKRTMQALIQEQKRLMS